MFCGQQGLNLLAKWHILYCRIAEYRLFPLASVQYSILAYASYETLVCKKRIS